MDRALGLKEICPCLSNSHAGNRIIHYSVDDVWLCLRDLTEQPLSSAFQQPYLAELKRLHDRWGICVTLNTFNSFTADPSYSIENVPACYREEFRANSHWLKFAFHAENEYSNYNTSEGIGTSYALFLKALDTFATREDCLDRVTRLGFFGGSKEHIRALCNQPHGILGLLCADTVSRSSYYLSPEQNRAVQTDGILYDEANHLMLIKTITRNLQESVHELESHPVWQHCAEIFTHEYEGLPDFEPVAVWAAGNGFVNAFPEKYFRLT